MHRQILSDMLKVHADATASLEQLLASSKQLQAAQEALASVQVRFETGHASFVDVLQSQSSLVSAQRLRARSIDQWRSARSRLGRIGAPDYLPASHAMHLPPPLQ